MNDDLEQLLRAEREAPAAPATAKARVLEAVRATVAAVPPASAPSNGAPPNGAGPMLGGATAKLAGVFLAGAVAGAGVHALVREPERVVVPVEVVREVVVEKEVEKPVEEVEAPLVAEPPPVPPAKRRKPAPARSDLAAERVLLEQARTALGRRNAADALVALQTHRARFPKGQLREERLALEVQALVSADRRSDAEARARELRSEFPRSLFLPIVEAALAEGAR